MLHWPYVFSLKFELSESILKQLIKHLFYTFLLLFRLKSKYGCPISYKITEIYFILNIIQLSRGFLNHYWTSALSYITLNEDTLSCVDSLFSIFNYQFRSLADAF